nr:molybdopterin-synthase adenylyltransferase MoeB [Parahaliea mediterranea]
MARYARQILLPGFDIAGQERLLAASVLVVGLGGLGSPVALYLGGAGVGRLLLADDDRVELSNLQRQLAHTQAGLGTNKAASAAAAVAARNPDVAVEVIAERLSEPRLRELARGVDLVVDCTDNYPARHALNRACIAAGVPLVSAAAVRAEGQIAVFHPAAGGPCYRCLYPEAGAATALSCSESGVLGPVVGVLGSLQAMEALKLLAGYGEALVGGLLVLDLASLEVRRLSIAPRPGCPDCAACR